MAHHGDGGITQDRGFGQPPNGSAPKFMHLRRELNQSRSTLRPWSVRCWGAQTGAARLQGKEGHENYAERGAREHTGEYGRMAPTQRRGSRVAVGKMEGSGLLLCVGCARTGGASAQKACMRGAGVALSDGRGIAERTGRARSHLQARCSSQTQWVSRSFALLPCKGLVGDEHRNCRCPPQRRAVTGTNFFYGCEIWSCSS